MKEIELKTGAGPGTIGRLLLDMIFAAVLLNTKLSLLAGAIAPQPDQLPGVLQLVSTPPPVQVQVLAAWAIGIGISSIELKATSVASND
jgi:hypothetical protein